MPLFPNLRRLTLELCSDEEYQLQVDNAEVAATCKQLFSPLNMPNLRHLDYSTSSLPYAAVECMLPYLSSLSVLAKDKEESALLLAAITQHPNIRHLSIPSELTVLRNLFACRGWSLDSLHLDDFYDSEEETEILSRLFAIMMGEDPGMRIGAVVIHGGDDLPREFSDKWPDLDLDSLELPAQAVQSFDQLDGRARISSVPFPFV